MGVGHLMIGLLKVSPILRAHCQAHGHTPRQLRHLLRTRIGTGEGAPAGHAKLADRLVHLFERAKGKAGDEPVDDLPLVQALAEEKSGVAGDIVALVGLDPTKVRAAGEDEAPDSDAPVRYVERVVERRRPSRLEEMGRDLTKLAREGKLRNFVGRKEMIQRVLVVLARESKPNVALVGDAGVGKTAVVEGLAQRIASGQVPPSFQKTRLVAVDPSALTAGASLVGELEARLRGVIEEAQKDPNLVLFFDEMHGIMGLGGAALTAADVLKPALARGEIRVIGATTPAEFARFVEKDSAMSRRFERVEVEEPSPEEAIEILRGARERLEAHHDVTIEDLAITSAVNLSVRYLVNRRLPDKALDLLDEAAGRTRLSATVEADAKPRSLVIGRRQVAEALSARTKVPIEDLTKEERAGLSHLEEQVRKRVIGQEAAISAICRRVQAARVGLKPEGRPVGAFLLTGPSGVGKTRLAETVAELGFGKGSMTRIDLSEYQEAHSVSRLVGAPPGYVGHERGGALTEALRRKPHALVLLDEADKAHPAIFDVFLQVLEGGRITDGRGETIDAGQALFLFTSNHLADGKGTKKVGFGLTPEPAAAPAPSGGGGIGFGGGGAVMTDDKARKELGGRMRPEFIGRLDGVLKMELLAKDTYLAIAELLLAEASDRLARRGVTLVVEAGVAPLLGRSGSDDLGARPIRTRLERDVLGRASELLLGEDPVTTITVRVSEGALVVEPSGSE